MNINGWKRWIFQYLIYRWTTMFLRNLIKLNAKDTMRREAANQKARAFFQYRFVCLASDSQHSYSRGKHARVKLGFFFYILCDLQRVLYNLTMNSQWFFNFLFLPVEYAVCAVSIRRTNKKTDSPKQIRNGWIAFGEERIELCSFRLFTLLEKQKIILLRSGNSFPFTLSFALESCTNYTRTRHTERWNCQTIYLFLGSKMRFNVETSLLLWVVTHICSSRILRNLSSWYGMLRNGCDICDHFGSSEKSSFGAVVAVLRCTFVWRMLCVALKQVWSSLPLVNIIRFLSFERQQMRNWLLVAG